jgi:hypothetical protein
VDGVWNVRRAIVPARPDRCRRFVQRLRMLAAHTRAIAWKLVKLSGEEYVVDPLYV